MALRELQRASFRPPAILREALIESLCSSIRAFLQVFLWGKGCKSTTYDPLDITPSPKPPSLQFIQSFLRHAVLLAMLSMYTLSWAAGPGYRSVYTSLKECRVIESSEQEADAEIDYFSTECPGREGYRIFHEGEDARSWIIIKRGEESVIDLYDAIMRNQPGAFPFVSGEVAEWRYNGKSLNALIFRIAGSELETDMIKSELMVVRLDAKQACVIGFAASNEEAREIADSNKACRSTAEDAGK